MREHIGAVLGGGPGGAARRRRAYRAASRARARSSFIPLRIESQTRRYAALTRSALGRRSQPRA